MNLDKIIEHRKHLHQHPEVSGNEIETSKYIKKVFGGPVSPREAPHG